MSINEEEFSVKWVNWIIDWNNENSVQSESILGFNDNIYHEGNPSKMPDFDVFSLLEFRKRTARSHRIKNNGNCKRKSRV